MPVAPAPSVSSNGDPRRDRVFSLVCTAIIAGALIALSLTHPFYEKTIHDVFFSLTLVSFVFVPLYICRWRDWIWILGSTFILAASQSLVLGMPLKAFQALALLGISSLVFLIVRRALSTELERSRLRSVVLPLLLIFALTSLSGALLNLTTRLYPKIFDVVLYNFDASLGLEPSFKVGQILLRWRWLGRAALDIYYGLPIAIMLIYAKQLRYQGAAAWRILVAIALAGPAGLLFYGLLPACGPAYLAGAQFPFHPLTTRQLTDLVTQAAAPDAPRNAFPSLHFTWALLAWWYSEGLSSRTRFCFFVFVVGIGLAALGLGEHYFIDLVVAVPFALVIQALFALEIPMFDQRRAQGLLGGLLLVLGWTALLRFGQTLIQHAAIVPWAMIVITVVLSLFLQRRLRVSPVAI